MSGGSGPQTDEEQRRVDAQVDRLTGAINHMLANFQQLFTGHSFLRMQTSLNGASPSDFMHNFESSFNPSDDIFEMVRRISEQEAEKNRKKNKAN